MTRRWMRAVALVVLAAPGAAAWAPLVDGFRDRVTPAIAVACLVALTRRPRRAAAFALAAWLVATPLLAAVPDHDPRHLLAGAQALTRVSEAPVGQDPWALAAALLAAGSLWLAAAALPPGPAFAAAVAPWGAALALGPPNPAVWQGGAIVLGALIWCAAPRARVAAVLALGLAAALAATAAAQAVGPHHRWLRLPAALDHTRPRFRSLTAEPTFGPLGDRRPGSTMLEIEAAAPMLWRMQPLDVFDGVTWRAARGSPPLPQPAAVRMQIAVHVRGLRGDLAVSPGRIESIEGAAAARPVDDEAWSLAPQPGPGATYRVSARAVNVDANRLWRAPAPDDLRLLDYTRVRGRPATIALGPLSVPIRPPRPIDIATPLWGWPASEDARAAAAGTPYARVAALARRLAAGAHTQYGVVQRVQRYLLSSRFRYTTDVVKPGRFPLADFLLRTHAGYCQHFAGAAALLLRLAGVPTRMVAGFATGIAHSGRYDVRDVDAHDWIEVYFQGVGWVPFNPTPAADPASVSGAFAAGAGRRGGDGPPVAIAVLALAALAAAACVPGRRDPAERLARLLGAGPDATLADIRAELARSVGPHTAALAAELERRRFAPAGAPRRRTSSLARALARDAGPTRPWRAARLLIRSAR